ncbi:hypothetical protein [Fuchsiella alkaliacetigena]|uniref:hypothetical protein n=1 Tax=Fuchsiella alkaliacetigena TaxID=957042 RepID=UPI00200A1CAC|nr:hypothetical protein [Fuchsiella alkaliacetigena]MCK8824076.1 hypothetical protein [Fuchsiella alkaliacetigena]
MNKRLVVFCLVLSCLLLTSVGWANEQQENEEEIIIDVEDYRLEEEGASEREELDLDELDFDVDEFKSNVDLRFNMGPQFALLKLDLSDLNTELAENDVDYKAVGEDLFLSGFGLIAGSRKGSRFAYHRLSGEEVSTGDDGARVNLEVGYSGFLYEKAFYTTENNDLAWGVLLGKGDATLMKIPEKGAEKIGYYTKSFLAFQPGINFHRQISSLVGFDLSLGYLITHSSGWETAGYSQSVAIDDFRAPVFSLRFSFGF